MSAPVFTKKPIQYYGAGVSHRKVVPISRAINRLQYVVKGVHKVWGNAITCAEED
jgi:hypothetical protein